jgi:hypothetical protein
MTADLLSNRQDDNKHERKETSFNKQEHNSSTNPDQLTNDAYTVEALRAALVQSQRAHQKSLKLLQTFGNSLAAELCNDDAASAHRKISVPASAVASANATNEQNVRNLLMDLPGKSGWLMEESFIGKGQNFSRRFAKIQFDSLYLCDDEQSSILNAQRYDLSNYQLIHLIHPVYKHAAADGRSARENENEHATNPQSPPAPHDSASAYPHSVLIREKGAYVIHLLPKPGCSATALHLSGADEESVSDGGKLKEWSEAINARIELLQLLQVSNLSTLLMNGGRAILTFLCSIDSRHLRIENESISLLPTLQHFKEHLILRAPYALTLRNVCLVDADLKIISEICMMNHGITSLDLSYNAITDAGFSYILSIVEVSKGLLHLKLDGNMLTGEGFEDLANLLWLRKIQTLSFESNAITTSNCVSFFNQWYNSIPATAPSLEMIELNLSNNPIDDRVSESLCLLLKRCTIQQLRLAYTNIRDQTVESLAATFLSFPHSIELWDFSFNKLTESSLAALSPALSACPSAINIDLSGIPFSFEQLQMLSASGVPLETSRLVVKKRTGAIVLSQHNGINENVTDQHITPNTANVPRPEALGRRMSFVREDVETGEVEILNPSSTAAQQAHTEHLPISEPVLNTVASITSSSSGSPHAPVARRNSLSVTLSPADLQHADSLAVPAAVATSVENLEDGNTVRPSDRDVLKVEKRRDSLSQ